VGCSASSSDSTVAKGTASTVKGPVPRTGHAFNYRETIDGIKIVHWYRQRQNVKR